MRSFLLKYITQIEEEVRALAAYKFDECNDNGRISWYSTEAYNPRESLQEKMRTISGAYNELGRSKLEYVKFYMNNHQQIPTWIMMKVVNFSTFISLVQYSKKVLELCENKKVQGFLPASSVTDFFYLVRRSLHSTDLAYKAVRAVLDIVKVLTVTNHDVLKAFVQKASDFEDCLLAVCAKSNKCDAIVTRDKKDFSSFGMMLLSPDELLEMI